MRNKKQNDNFLKLSTNYLFFYNIIEIYLIEPNGNAQI